MVKFYDLQARVSSPVINNWLTLGLAGNYKASLAAKQRDPSVDTRFYTLRLVPSATFAFNEHHRAGVQIDYTSIKEDSRMVLPPIISVTASVLPFSINMRQVPGTFCWRVPTPNVWNGLSSRIPLPERCSRPRTRPST